MPISNFDYVLDAAKQLESAARRIRTVYVHDLSESERLQYIHDAEANINAALARIASLKTEMGR